ncbi:hypothetical protein [Shewanella algae]|nr:hypothetical protein [Shewanella algae]
MKKPFGLEAAVIDFFMTQELFWVRDRDISYDEIPEPKGSGN